MQNVVSKIGNTNHTLSVHTSLTRSESTKLEIYKFNSSVYDINTRHKLNLMSNQPNIQCIKKVSIIAV